MATTSRKELSKHLSWELDELGFDRRRIRERIHIYNLSSRAKVMSTKTILKTDNIEKIYVGSMREGIGMKYCNDEDILQISHAVICKRHGSCVNENGKVVFKMIQHGAPAGYTYLKLLSKNSNSEALQNLKYALIRKKTGTFISSKIFMTKNDDVFKSGVGIISKNTCYKPPEGPSIPKYVEPNMVAKHFLSQMNLSGKGIDFVRAFPCTADSILEKWSTRERNCGWPRPKTIAHVKSLPAHVVPVGCKDDINADLQWRICLTMAEIHLVQDFSNVQTKVFVIMKLIAKHMLQPVCKCITSYAVKMVMLWFVEKTPKKKFRKKHLLSRLADAIKCLKNAVENKCLPSYMIPKRNLFAKKMSKGEQYLVVEKLNFLLRDGVESLKRYFYDDYVIHEDLLHIRDQLCMSNHMCKVNTCLLALFTTKQLANYMTKAFLCRSWLYMSLYNILFVWIPYFFRYGKKGFGDPLSFRLDCKLAMREKEAKRLQQKKIPYCPIGITENEHGTILPTILCTMDKFKISLEKLLLFTVSLVIPVALLYFLKQLVPLLQKALDCDCIQSEISEGQAWSQ